MTDPRHKWDTVYAEDAYVFGTAPNDCLAEVARRIPPGRVLCLADGEGRNGAYLAGLGYEVVSVDVSPVGLAKARRLADARGVPLRAVAADLDDVRVERGGWSGIVSIFAHLPAELRVRVHGRAVRGLAPGGAFVLEAFAPRPADGDARRAGGAALRRELAGLRMGVLREVCRDIREGPRHNGPGEVVQLLAFKPGPEAGR